jgi:hypothetical protein
MFRTVSVPDPRSSAVIKLVLCILIACLSIHFLLEDTQLLTASTASDRNPASDLSYAEMTHQDDLVILVPLPESNAKKDLPPVTACDALFIKQIKSLILTPPKIA